MKTVKLPAYQFFNSMVDNLNKEVTKSHKRILKTSVLIEAKSYASKNLPSPGESSISPYILSTAGQYQALKKDIAVKLKGGYQKFCGAININSLNEKIAAIRTAIKEEVGICNNLISDNDRIAGCCNNAGYKRKHWLLFLFGLAESLLTMACFLKIGDIVLIAALVGLVIGLAQVYSAKTSVLAIREIEDKEKCRLYYTITFAGFTLFSITLGLLRYYYAHQGAAANVPFIFLNPFMFAAFNMLLIIASGLLVYHYFPSKVELIDLEDLKNIKKQIKQSQIKQKQLLAELEKLLNKRAFITMVHGQIIHDEQKLFEKIDSFYLEAEGTFRNENLSKRHDGLFPLCFRNPHLPLPGSDIENFKTLA
jgi:hypothetical protein